MFALLLLCSNAAALHQWPPPQVGGRLLPQIPMPQAAGWMQPAVQQKQWATGWMQPAVQQKQWANLSSGEQPWGQKCSESPVDLETTDIFSVVDFSACEQRIEGTVSTHRTAQYCVISAGRNPALQGDPDHYTDQQWKDILVGNAKAGQFQLNGLDQNLGPNNMFPHKCWICPVCGVYKGVKEDSIVVMCNKRPELISACKTWGNKLKQDSVIVSAADPSTEGVGIAELWGTYNQVEGIETSAWAKWDTTIAPDGAIGSTMFDPGNGQPKRQISFSTSNENAVTECYQKCILSGVLCAEDDLEEFPPTVNCATGCNKCSDGPLYKDWNDGPQGNGKCCDKTATYPIDMS